MLKKTQNPWLKSKFKWNGLNRKIHKYIIAHSKNNRPSSGPYISGDGFRSFADHVYEDEKLFNKDQVIQKNNFVPEQVKQGDVVFVDARSVKYFFQTLHPQIKYKYILITHNADTNIDETYIDFIDDRIIKWFAQNVIIKHEKLIPIPIGLENLYYYNNGITKYFDNLKKKIGQTKKKNRILYGFSIDTNENERQGAYTYLKKSEVADEIQEKLNSKMYLKLLTDYKFVASPPGNGVDCIRTWEALYLDVVPIVKRSVVTEYFSSLGLPMLIIDNWQEIENYTEEQLRDIYDEKLAGFNKKIPNINYWYKIILQVKYENQ